MIPAVSLSRWGRRLPSDSGRPGRRTSLITGSTQGQPSDVCTEHARNELMRMLSVHASVPYAYAQLAHQKLNEGLAPPKIKIIS